MKKNKPLFLPQEKKDIGVIGLLLFFRMSGVFLVLPVLSALAAGIPGAEPWKIGLAFGAYGLTQGLLQLPMGMLSDRYGRKLLLLIGFFIFLAGSLLCAFSQDFLGLIIGRFLQGVGAVSSVIFALLADKTRPEVRTRANALLGSGIGVAFALSFVFAPILGDFAGLLGVFGFISFLAFFSLLLIFFFISDVPQAETRRKDYRKLIQETLANRKLWAIFAGSFAGGAGLSATMFLVPLKLHEMGFAHSRMWEIYLPMLVLGAFFMVGAAYTAEAKKKYREVFFFGNALFFLSAIIGIFVFSQSLGFWGWILFLYVFFCGYNVFEPIFPSLCTKLSSPESKGTVSGVVNFFQFFGYFIGGSLSGYLIDHSLFLFSGLILFYLIFLFHTFRFKPT